MFEALLKLRDFFRFAILGTIPNEICQNHTAEVWNNVKKMKMWAIKMVDSTAKIPVGLLTGNLVHFGNIDECLDVKVNEDFGSFTGQHCMAEFQLPLPQTVNQNAAPLFKYQWGVCIPSTCTAKDLKYFLRYTFHLPAETDDSLCHTLDMEPPYKTHELITILIILLLSLLAAMSTLYDYATSKGKQNQYLLAFSIKTNLRNLLDTKSSPESVDIMHGLRFVAIVFVVLGHVYMTQALAGTDINRIEYKEWLSDWSHTWLTCRGVGVDAFFVFGGLLISYLFLRDREKGKSFNIIQFYFHRYIRLAPVLAFMTLFEATVINRIGSGPWWQRFSQQVEESCQKMWWKHILFINNWWGIEKCMEHTWYLCVDMQLYLLSPLLLIPLHRWPRVGLGLSYGALFTAFFVSFGISYGMEEKVDLFRNGADEMERKFYRATYHRITPWLIGFILGYYLHKYKHLRASPEGKQRHISGTVNWGKVITIIATWTVVFMLPACVMLAVHPFVQPNYNFNAFESATYLATSHVIVALFVAVMIIACLTGYGGPFTVVLSWKCFVPISRLSYSIFVIHLTIVKLRLINERTTTFLSDFNLGMSAVSVLVYSIFISCFTYLTIEQPIAILERLLLNREKRGLPPEPLPSTSYEASTLPLSMTRGGGNINMALEMSETNASKPH